MVLFQLKTPTTVAILVVAFVATTTTVVITVVTTPHFLMGLLAAAWRTVMLRGSSRKQILRQFSTL
jgi:hypothetical protein